MQPVGMPFGCVVHITRQQQQMPALRANAPYACKQSAAFTYWHIIMPENNS
jgi:hypothetical protein